MTLHEDLAVSSMEDYIKREPYVLARTPESTRAIWDFVLGRRTQ